MKLLKENPFVSIRTAAIAAASTTFLSLPTMSFAAAAGATGIDGSFTTMLGDLTGMLGGNFGALILLISLIIGVAVYGVTANWRYVIASVMVAFLIGYGVDIVQGIGGVTATVDMLTVVQPVADPTVVGPV